MYGAIVQQILATQDLASMARVIQEAVHLSATQERDVLEINKRYETVQVAENNLHEEIMTGLVGRLNERASQIALSHRMIEFLMNNGQATEAKDVMLKLMGFLQDSPADTAMQQRNSFYRR